MHVGGTNGKGSVAVLVAEALRADGRRVGVYTSPHLIDVRERMVVNDDTITADAFAVWTAELQAAIEEVGASFFEATTAIALADFAARGVEIAVIEVGLGGRLDSTNVLDPLVSVVTGVSLEHTDYLGDTIEDIAREKAGIAKPGRPFVVGELEPRRAALLERLGADRGALPRPVAPEQQYSGVLALRGAHQRRNAAVAAEVLAALPDEWRPTRDAIARGFARARLAGRLDYRGKWILDVAHNPGGVAVLLAALAAEPPPRPLHALVGILKDKDWPQMLTALTAAVDGLWVTVPPTAPSERAWQLDRVRAAFPQAVVEPAFDVALAGVQHGAATVLVTGSFHTVGDAMMRLPGFAPLR